LTRRAPWLGVIAVMALAGCDGGIQLPGTKADVPTSLTARSEATSLKGTIYLAQGGRIWKLRSGKLTALTPANQTLAYPTTSADGSVTAVSVVGRGQAQIAVGGPDFTGLTSLTPARSDAHLASLDLKPSLSPDGKRLVFMSDRSSCCSDEAIWEGPIRLPHEVSFPPDFSGGDDAPAYLPDTSGIVFVAWRDNHGNLDKAAVPSGRASVVVTGAASDILDPAPGAAGKMAWVSRKGDVANIVVGKIDGSGAAVVANLADCRQPVWSPDGRNLLFISAHGGSTDLWLASAAGSTPQRLTWGADIDANSHPAWIAG
jgi:Tol biopolymer transport system component